jgi:hypothetical protein
MAWKTGSITISISGILGGLGIMYKNGYVPILKKECCKRMNDGNDRFNQIEKNLKKLTIIENLLLVMATPEQKEQAKQNSELFDKD